MEWAIGNEEQLGYRQEALAEARGRILELGFGTGLNLACYPEGIDLLVATDPIRVLEARVRRRIAATPFPVLRTRLDAARLPFPEAAFDTVASTWTLCTIAEPLMALAEAHRVLAPPGLFLFMEHGRSDAPRVARWQERLDPIQKVVACGCQLSRPIDALVREAGFEILVLERFQMPGTPRVLGEIYRGVAQH